MDEVYTAEMGNPPADDDMMSIEMLQGKRKPMPKRPVAAAPAPAPRPVPRPTPRPVQGTPAGRDLGQLEDDMGSIESLRPKTSRQKKAAKDIKTAMGMKSGGKVGSASKRADGCATKGKTKGRMI